MVLLGLNDHLFKYQWPGAVTGKLSDFAGMIFFPLIVEYIVRSRRTAVALTGAVFFLVKATPWGALAWNALFTWIYQLGMPGAQARLLQDPSDLIALSALLVPLLMIPDRKFNAKNDHTSP